MSFEFNVPLNMSLLLACPRFQFHVVFLLVNFLSPPLCQIIFYTHFFEPVNLRKVKGKKSLEDIKSQVE